MNTSPPLPPPEALAARVLARIETGHIAPRSRFSFLLENYVFWTLGALAAGFGALAFAAGLFEVANVDWSLYAATHGDFLSFFLEAAPFLWLFLLALFVLLGYVNIRRTRRGYRYPLAVIALGAVLTSVTFGSALYAAGFGAELEEALGDHPPFYRPVLVEEHAWWSAPAKGLLGGSVVSAAPEASSFVLRDFGGREWNVDAQDLLGSDLVTVARGGMVRVVGVPATTTDEAFHACFVFPWHVSGHGPLAAPPAPVAIFASSTERIAPSVRSESCKGIRPYAQLRALDEHGFF